LTSHFYEIKLGCGVRYGVEHHLLFCYYLYPLPY
jgi:hypothetical protein